jgi:N-acyl homoserine lactone hydrolase
MVMGRSSSCPFPATPRGQQGAFLKLGQRRVFLIGDAADTLEAAERGQFLV